MSTSNSSNPMRDQVYSLPTLIREQIWELEEKTRKVLTTPEIFSIRQIVLTGCGDSHISGIAAQFAFSQLTSIPTRALNAMQASRYHSALVNLNYPNNPLVFAISNSGEVARVIEAVVNYRQQDALTVAITANSNSRLAQQSERVIQTDIPPLVSSPGVRSFYISLLTLYLIAIRLGEVRGKYTMEEAMNLRRELESCGDTIEKSIEKADEAMKQLAHDWSQYRAFELLGSGPDRATAAYGAAKLLEATGVHAIHQDVEEWVHLQYFIRDARNTATLVIAPGKSPALSRVVEIEPFIKTLERPYHILTSDACAKHFDRSLSFQITINPLFAPLVYCASLALFTAHLTEKLGETYGRGATGQWADCANGMTTRNSEIIGMTKDK